MPETLPVVSVASSGISHHALEKIGLSQFTEAVKETDGWATWRSAIRQGGLAGLAIGVSFRAGNGPRTVEFQYFPTVMARRNTLIQSSSLVIRGATEGSARLRRIHMHDVHLHNASIIGKSIRFKGHIQTARELFSSLFVSPDATGRGYVFRLERTGKSAPGPVGRRMGKAVSQLFAEHALPRLEVINGDTSEVDEVWPVPQEVTVWEKSLMPLRRPAARVVRTLHR